MSTPATPTTVAPGATAPRMVRTAQAAVILGVAAGTLKAWRARGKGPPFRRLEAAIVYDAEELEAWRDRRLQYGGRR